MKKFVFSLLVLCGCISNEISEVPVDILKPTYDTNSLKSNDLTYRIKTNQVINVSVGRKTYDIMFDKSWYIVHEDWIKKFNENQDSLLSILEQDNTKKNLTSTNSLTIL